MKTLTSNIIALLKGNHKYVDDNQCPLWGRALLKKYLSSIYGIPEENYTDDDIMNIIKEAVLDYISTSDQPDDFLKTYFSWLDIAKSGKYGKLLDDDLEAWMTALANVQVLDSKKYINGFNKINSNLQEIK